jgi:hypothetical protein
MRQFAQQPKSPNVEHHDLLNTLEKLKSIAWKHSLDRMIPGHRL